MPPPKPSPAAGPRTKPPPASRGRRRPGRAPGAIRTRDQRLPGLIRRREVRTSLPVAAALAAAVFLGAGATPGHARSTSEVDWNPRFYDPAGNADLVLPLPCGGAMAFQRVDTPVPADDPIGDRTVQLGLGDTAAGFVSYLRRAHIRGGFTGEAGAGAHYFMGRYELTRDQLAALRGECPKPSMRGRVPASGLSWFDAVDAARRMTEWLRAETPDALPAEQGVPGFVRLPTEVEWEYAVRGGAAVDASVFNQRTFPIDGAMRDFAWHQGASSARGSLRPAGLLGPNPIGLHDVYGGVEELMLEPFRLNALGRTHGQPGGVTTRGGSILSTPGELSSGLRQEFPAYGASDGRPVALDTFGARFVIGVHLSVSTERTNVLRTAWLDHFGAEGIETANVSEDLTAALDALISNEIERDRRVRLEAIRLLATEERRERKSHRLEALKASILGGAILVQFLREDARGIERLENALVEFERTIEQASDGKGIIDAEDIERLRKRRDRIAAGLESRQGRFNLNFLSYERNLVNSATEYGATERRQALDVLLSELQLSGRAGLAPLAREFHDDVAAYHADPDMPTADIRRSALE